MDASEMAAEGRRLCQLLDQALGFMKEKVKEAAEAERDYRSEKAKAWAQARIQLPDGTVPEREAWVNGVIAELRWKRDLADGMRRAAMQAIESRRQQISLLQSVANAYREEAAYTRTGPEMAA